MDAEGQLYSQFLDLVHITDGKADSIVAAMKEVLHTKKVPTQKLYGLAADGAAVMTGMNFIFIFTNQRYLFSCQRELKKPENIHIY